MKKKLLTLILVVALMNAKAQRIITEHLVTDISFLASDEMNGRATNTPDELIVADYIARIFEANDLQPKGNNGFFFDYTYKLSKNIHDSSTVGQAERKGRNVIAFLNNKAEKTIVIGAHYDHCGLGHDGNSLDPNPHGKIHNGADDNASGVAGVLELARYFSNNGIQEKNNFLFMTFSGEELGLLGSKKWCENPSYPLSKINYMLNMDMIGRLDESTKKLLIYGVGTSPAWLPSIEKTNKYFTPKYDSAGVGPSDQTSFYLKDIPVLHFFTGQHSDYHKPTDDADKINYAGEAKILDFMIDLIFELDEQPKLSFLKTKTIEMKNSSFKVTMGIMPDYAFDEKGLRLDGITDDKPASKAGLKQGDIIIQMDEAQIESVQDYMKELNNHAKGDEVKVIFLRKNEKLETTVQF